MNRKFKVGDYVRCNRKTPFYKDEGIVTELFESNGTGRKFVRFFIKKSLNSMYIGQKHSLSLEKFDKIPPPKVNNARNNK